MSGTTWATSALAGTTFHAFAQWVELDLRVPQTLASLAVAAFALFYVDVQVFESTRADAAATLAKSALGFVLSVTACTLVYRVFFHRLRKVPGPFPAKLSKFYGVYLSRNLQYHFEVEKLHSKYGDVVRTGPRELSVARASPLTQIIACRKSAFYSMADAKRERQGLPFLTDFEEHRKRRRGWDMSMTMQQLGKYDVPMQSMIGLFLDRLSAPEQLGKSLDISAWISWLSYDIMGIVGYGKDFGMLSSATDHDAIKNLRKAMKVLGFMKQVPWLTNFLGHFPGGQGAMGPFGVYSKELVTEKRKSLMDKTLDSPSDIVTWLIKAYEEKTPWAAPTIEALDDDSRALVIGGADTSSATMVCMLFYLCKHPEIYSKLQAQLDAVFPDGPSSFAYDLVDRVPLVEAIVTEALRLQPAVPSGQPRVTPPEGLHVPASNGEEGDLYIPGNTIVLMPQWVIQRDERYFEKATEFVPERWIVGGEKAGMVKERNAFFPFQVGIYHCVGKQLAIWEMKSVLARIALQFDVKFVPGEDGKKFEAGFLDTWTLTIPPLHLCFEERNAAKS